MSGGDINNAYKIESEEQSYFIKINKATNLQLLESEVIGLKEISDSSAINSPKPIAIGTYEKNCFLILEFIEFQQALNMKSLARDLANLHNNHKHKFGFKINNYIGKIKQINHAASDWINFYFNNRIMFQMELLSKNMKPKNY